MASKLFEATGLTVLSYRGNKEHATQVMHMYNDNTSKKGVTDLIKAVLLDTPLSEELCSRFGVSPVQAFCWVQEAIDRLEKSYSEKDQQLSPTPLVNGRAASALSAGEIHYLVDGLEACL